ncbi:MAG: NAD(P)-binding protein [Syntrophomonadaceae bacterium]|nr:NAD(P)-binding protein [Syntrophomonadaceae bacterium]
MDQKKWREREARCIQEEAPGCTAACPVHVDGRGIALAVRKKDYAAGFMLLNKMLPFPRIISRICDQPCRQACKRKDLGGAIHVNALERCCAENYDPPAPKILQVKAKDKKVAVIGAGLSGLTAAVELAKKGYKVVVFEATHRLAGSIRDISESILPAQTIEDDLAYLEKLPLEIRYDARISNSGSKMLTFDDVCTGFDAVYLGVGCLGASSLNLGLELNSAGKPVIDPVTFATSRSKVFAGGSLLLGTHGKSPITSISHGKIAANSIDRLFQNASLTVGREKEGPFDSSLYTNIDGVEFQVASKEYNPVRGYIVGEALREANRCLLCECMECVKVCEFLANYGSYPKRYVREVYNNLSIVMGIHHANATINSCRLCGLCEQVCPGGLNMGEIYKEARQIMVKKGKMPPTAHDFALRDMQFSTGTKFVLNKHQPGYKKSSIMFFPGCQLSASSPQNVRRIYEFLCAKTEGGAGLSLGCCGAPADWAGRQELFKETIRNVENNWLDLGQPRVITGCPTCYSIFKRELPQMEAETVWTFLEQIGLPDKAKEGVSPKKLAVHDACTTRHEARLQKSIRSILHKLGHQVEELDTGWGKTECCGYGGLQLFANRDLARKGAERRIKESEADYLAYCAMCRDIFAGRGKRVYHLLDLIFSAKEQDPATQKGPGFSERHENRARLRETLLKEVWGETVEERQSEIKLIIPEAVGDVMEDRMILREDVAKVIAHAEKSGNKFKNMENNSFIACFKPVSVTYWVEYTSQGDGFLVRNAYSHRLEISE